ncbi:hypothetical protein LIER_05654 [Lithospermum erythrorhizon]|uniref:Zinc-finger domain-containing protein n=1 Tax=Lithospermum erythrorhizon TaxID=34254 RepID=A0AAV3P285_LITER
MGKPGTNSAYEQIRQARIQENKRRLATLGVQKTLTELKSLASATKSEKTHVRKLQKVDYSSTPLRRSSRLRGSCCYSEKSLKALPFCPSTPTIKEKVLTERFSPEALSRRCTSKGRGSLYDPTYGICCHFCRQKKLCGEEDCKRCGDLDLDQPCIGKTDCSICHSSTGVLCRACLLIRYGEELEEVRANKQWACPHCIEDEGTRPYWICNSSLCLKRRKMVPTGIAIYTARKMGYKSVAHLLMDKLKQGE